MRCHGHAAAGQRPRLLRGVAGAVFALGVASLTLGCAAPPRRATVAALYYRAVYDLGCPAQQMQLYNVDGRTKALAGCGRRLVYVEQCDPAMGTFGCTWLLDTPSFAQAQWPQQQQAWEEQQRRALQAQGNAPPQWRWQPRRQRRFERDLGSQRVTVQRPRDPLDVPPAGPGQRSMPTDLFSRDKQPVPEGKKNRPMPQELFGNDDKVDEQRREDALGF